MNGQEWKRIKRELFRKINSKKTPRYREVLRKKKRKKA